MLLVLEHSYRNAASVMQSSHQVIEDIALMYVDRDEGLELGSLDGTEILRSLADEDIEEV